MTGVTVIVCCYNSSPRIGETLAHLAAQENSVEFKWEILLVDNASSDNTAAKARNIWSQYDRPDVEFKIVSQPIPGLVNARQKGVDCAQYDVVIFCDDDNWLCPDYIQSALEILRDPTLDIVCGYGTAVTQAAFPKWFTHVFPFYACHTIEGNQTVSRKPEEFQYGAGMVIRRSLLKQIASSGYEYYLEDRNGSKLSSGQDTELILLAKILNKKVITSATLRFHHYIPESRLSKKYLYRLIQGVCSCGFKLEPFRIYLQNAKPLKNTTWLKDTLYVGKYFLRSSSSYLMKRSFENKIDFLMNWHALLCSISNCNQYEVIGRRLDMLKANIGENAEPLTRS